jgi:hypothetical protein
VKKKVVVLLLGSSVVYGQMNERQTKSVDASKINLKDYMRFGLVVGTRTLDYSTTREGVRLGAHEAVLPRAFAASDTRLASFEGALTIGQIAGDVWLIKHHHRVVAESLDWISIGVGGLVDANNKRVIDNVKSRRSKLTKE